jgi:putative hydrolase of the HAD superfamily
MPRFLLLDLDGTLIDDRSATRAGYDAFLAHHRPGLEGRARQDLLATWRTIAERHWARHEAGELTFLEYRRARVREFLGAPLGDAEADEAFRPYLAAYEGAWRLLPGVAEFLERTRHVPKVIVTNGDRDQQRYKLERTGLLEHVAGMVTPADCGHWKPAPQIFHAALALLGARAEQCLMVGDDPVRDIEPATRLGMPSVLVEGVVNHEMLVGIVG